MKKKEPQSVQFNGISWKTFEMGERVLLLQNRNVSIEGIHATSELASQLSGLTDIVPSYDSIALFHDGDPVALIEELSGHASQHSNESTATPSTEIPICYELGTDLETVARHSGLSTDEVISRYLAGTYQVELVGFTPGFIYMGGLDPALSCPRRSSPRTHLEEGSVGIGGEQTGIYSLASPGGWNIIGRTPMKLFNKSKHPPMDLALGTHVTYRRISKKEFGQWEA